VHLALVGGWIRRLHSELKAGIDEDDASGLHLEDGSSEYRSLCMNSNSGVFLATAQCKTF